MRLSASNACWLIFNKKEMITHMYSIYNECFGNTTDWWEFLERAKGMLTDHAEDQKKLVRLFMAWKQACEWEVHGERFVAALPPSDVAQFLWGLTEMLIKNAGGLSAWEALSISERHTCSQAALQTLHHEIGEHRFASLSDAEKGATDL